MKALFGTYLIFLIVATTFWAGTVQAHKIRVFAWQEGDIVFTEAKFSGGNPAKNVVVFVEDSVTHKRLLSGHTDEMGNFSFTVPTPAPSSLVVIVDGGDGHRNSWTHTLETEGDTNKEPPPGAPPVTVDKRDLPNPEVQKDSLRLDIEQFTVVLETVIDKKLGPIKKSLAENSDSGPSLQDILGGIGYIFGLAGIAAYFKSKKS